MKAASAALFAGIVGCAIVQLASAADAGGYRETVLHSFASGSDGANPFAGMIDVKGTLFGTTYSGGSSGNGTVFGLDPSTETENILYAFCKEKNCADGASPYASLILVNGTLYGTTYSGGDACGGVGCGVAFSLDPNTGTETVLHSFCSQPNCADGANPFDSLIAANRMLYGTADDGGSSIYGTAFALDRSTGTETVLYSFCQQKGCTDGQNPAPALLDLNGTLYGTTSAGGAYGCGNGLGCGTVFSLDPNTGTETVLHSFGSGTDGRVPEASLIVVDGVLYGTTYGGGVAGCGAFGCGTVFSINPNTGVETVLYSFCNRTNCAAGANPEASLISVKGTLYGTTSTGGGSGCSGSGCGTVFELNPNTDAETVVHSFCSQRQCADGATPAGSLIAVNGQLYGTTYGGGTYGYGTVFELKKKL